MTKAISKEARELEKYFKEKPGVNYTNRNISSIKDGRNSAGLIYNIIKMGNIQSVLEVGANLGTNLSKLKGKCYKIYGVDINEEALKTAQSLYPFAHFQKGSAYNLPFEDDSFELVFTRGVLIHIPVKNDDRNKVLKEMLRVSSKYIVNIEYACEDENKHYEIVNWRENQNLWRINVDKYWKDIGGVEIKMKEEVPLVLDKENMTLWVVKKK